MTCLWEILVPVTDIEGSKYPTWQHKEWDAKVREISGGLTIMPVVKGQWVCSENHILAEPMIPVRFIADRLQAFKVAKFTAEFYKQREVMMYVISGDVVQYREDEKFYA